MRRAMGPSLLPLVLLALPAQDAAPSEADLAFFEKEVRPVLVEHCYECHSDAKKRPKGGLRLDTRAGWVTGGDSGPALVPGNADESLLVRAVRYAEPEIEMPPDGKLPEAAIRALEEWVRRGAPDPRTGEATAKETLDTRPHWAFQPMQDPVPPTVADEARVASEIDRFVLAKLEGEGLTLAPEADRRTLLRRASQDLIGLPPTAEEFERFANDPAPDAWEKAVDRLLASPHYGERQARRWLDLARYADSNGLDENLAMANAWRYRDWVVAAFNADLPYDRFVTYQLAGDLLPEPADEQEVAHQLAATGFLVLGPKMLAEQDKLKLQMDIVDEQLDVASQAFLGLTMGCARCHDHKFDPLSQRDYTALAGIFKSTSTMANLEFVSRWRQNELAPAAKIEERRAQVAAIDETKAKLDGLVRAGMDELSADNAAEVSRYLLAATAASARALWLEAEEFSRGNLNVDRATYGSATEPVVHTHAGGLQFVEYDLAFAAPARLRLEVRRAAAESRPMRLLLDGVLVAENVLGEPTGGWNLPDQRWTSVALLDVHAGRNVLRLERDGAVPHLDQLLLVPAESLDDQSWLTADPLAAELAPEALRAWVARLERAGRGHDPLFDLWASFAALPAESFAARAEERVTELRAAAQAVPTPPDVAPSDAASLVEVEAAPAHRPAQPTNALVATLLDGLAPTSLRELAGRYQTLFAAVQQAWSAQRAAEATREKPALDDPAQEELRLVLHGPSGPFALPREAAEARFPEARRVELAALRADLAAREAALLPAFARAPGVRDAKEIVSLPLQIRGSHLNLGPEPIPRGFPAVLTAVVPAAPLPAESSGRLELARWLTDPEHPLTARVMANRVWQNHFGKGLVDSPSNFGRRGAEPTHPELLDWLARTLVRDGWSVKALHRRILLSATYRQSSQPAPEVFARDPENRLLARQTRRRLEAEAVRDALLAAAGTLDLTLGGSLLDSGDGDYVTNDQSGNAGRYDAPRRTLYLPIVRNALYDFLGAFDYRDPSIPVDQRVATTTASQALWLMNSPLALDAARHVAEAASAEAAEPPARVDALYRRTLGRLPDERERTLALTFVARLAAPQPTAGAPESAPTDPSAAWRSLAHTLLCSNEFLHVD